MSKNPAQDPKVVLDSVRNAWVVNPSEAHLENICVQAKQDIYSKTPITEEEAIAFCACNDNNPCGTKECD